LSGSEPHDASRLDVSLSLSHLETAARYLFVNLLPLPLIVVGVSFLLHTWEPVAGHVQYLHVTPGSDVTEIDILLRADGKDRTVATVRYTWTALGEHGRALVPSKTPESYRRFMQGWERELNHYLTTGKKLPAEH